MADERRKSKIKGTERSIFNGEPTDAIINSKVGYVYELTRTTPPHIYFLSKYVVVMGGTIFNPLEDKDPIKIPLRGSWRQRYAKHLPGRKPTDSEFDQMERDFGLTLPWPPLGLYALIQNELKTLQDELIANEDPIVMAPCRGYIDKHGILIDPAWNDQEEFGSQRISGYLFYRKDPEGLAIVQKYLLNEANLIFQRQVERVKYTAPKLMEGKMRAASTMLTKTDRRIQSIKSLDNLKTNEQISDWDNLKAIKK